MHDKQTNPHINATPFNNDERKLILHQLPKSHQGSYRPNITEKTYYKYMNFTILYNEKNIRTRNLTDLELYVQPHQTNQPYKIILALTQHTPNTSDPTYLTDTNINNII